MTQPIATCRATDLYVDGGCILANPSTIGATWAARYIVRATDQSPEDGDVIFEIAGVRGCTPRFPSVTNNVAELIAAVEGIERLAVGWRGTIYSDSAVTLGRLSSGYALRSVPAWLSKRCRAALRRIDIPNVQWVLLAGHPTADELAKGRARHGGRVSQHNKWCDRAARKAGAAYLAQVTS
jgi:ribonuclease HI